MIPPFDDHGYLPSGVHPAKLEEIDACFGVQSEIRRTQMESVRWMLDLAHRAGVRRVVLNGSFVTDIIEPNDVDCVLLIGTGYPKDAKAVAELEAGLPFLDIQVVEEPDFRAIVEATFSSDREAVPKGMIEVIP